MALIKSSQNIDEKIEIKIRMNHPLSHPAPTDPVQLNDEVYHYISQNLL